MMYLYLCLDCAHEWTSSNPYGYQKCDWCNSNNIKVLEGQTVIDRNKLLIQNIGNQSFPETSLGFEVQQKILKYVKNQD